MILPFFYQDPKLPFLNLPDQLNSGGDCIVKKKKTECILIIIYTNWDTVTEPLYFPDDEVDNDEIPVRLGGGLTIAVFLSRLSITFQVIGCR